MLPHRSEGRGEGGLKEDVRARGKGETSNLVQLAVKGILSQDVSLVRIRKSEPRLEKGDGIGG